MEFPHEHSWTIAFLTGSPSPAVTKHLEGEYLSVYVPTTPNPTSGYFIMVPRSRTRELDMSVDDALKYIISMGVVAPKIAGLRRRDAAPPAPIAAARGTASARRHPAAEIDGAAPAPARARAGAGRLARPAPDTCSRHIQPCTPAGDTLETHGLLRSHRPSLPRPDRHAGRLGPPPPRPRRHHLHRPARPRRPRPGRLRPGSARRPSPPPRSCATNSACASTGWSGRGPRARTNTEPRLGRDRSARARPSRSSTRRRRRRSSSTTRTCRRQCGSRTACSTCAGRRCSTT